MITDLKFPKWTDILLNVKEGKDDGSKAKTQIARQTGISYDHVHLTIKLMHQQGWVSLEKEGRVLVTTLTKKGKSIKDMLVNINEVISS